MARSATGIESSLDFRIDGHTWTIEESIPDLIGVFLHHLGETGVVEMPMLVADLRMEIDSGLHDRSTVLLCDNVLDRIVGFEDGAGTALAKPHYELVIGNHYTDETGGMEASDMGDAEECSTAHERLDAHERMIERSIPTLLAVLARHLSRKNVVDMKALAAEARAEINPDLSLDGTGVLLTHFADDLDRMKLVA